LLIPKVGPIVALGAAALLVASCLNGPSAVPSFVSQTPGPTASPIGTPAVSPIPSPSIQPAAAVDAAAWYPISIFPDQPALGVATMTAVTTTWFGFLAVGWTPTGGTSWWSNDGRNWTAALYQDPSLRDAMLTGVAASASRIVAIGATQARDGSTQAQIWTSPDGLAWTPILKVPPDTYYSVVSIVRTATAFVVVGTIDSGNSREAMWTSPDGIAWTETDLPNGAPLQIADGPAGPLVLEVAGNAGAEGRSASLIGPSGVVAAALPPGQIDTIAAGPDAYWAFGEQASAIGPGRPVYRSVDGQTWTRTGALPAMSTRLPTSVIAAAVAQVGGALVVVTSAGDPSRPDEVLRSSDGSEWNTVTWPSPLEKGAYITALAVGLDGIVGVGSIGQRRAAAWLGQPLAADSPGPLARDPRPTGCPSRLTWSGTPSAVLEAVLRLTDAQRVHCLGSRTIRVGGFLAEPEGLGGACAATATPDWLTGGCLIYPSGWLEDVGAPFGRADTLQLFDRPTLPRTLKVRRWIVATGHFDDPLSSTCREVGPDGKLDEPLAASVTRCRTHFAVTNIAAGVAPTPPPVDPAASLGLPTSDLLAPAFQGWDNMPLPLGTTFGFREVTPPAGVGVIVTVFAFVDPARASSALATVIGGGGTLNGTVLGVTVARTADGSKAIFVRGSHIYALQVESQASSPSAQEISSLETVLEALIQDSPAA
jgi:hypothetical protein